MKRHAYSIGYANWNYIICKNNNKKIFSRFAALTMCSVGRWQRAGECSCSVKLGHPTGFDLDRKGAEGHCTVCCSRCLVVYVILRADKRCMGRSNEHASLSAVVTASRPLSLLSLPHGKLKLWLLLLLLSVQVYGSCAGLTMITCVPFIILTDSKDEQNDRIY